MSSTYRLFSSPLCLVIWVFLSVFWPITVSFHSLQFQWKATLPWRSPWTSAWLLRLKYWSTPSCLMEKWLQILQNLKLKSVFSTKWVIYFFKFLFEKRKNGLRIQISDTLTLAIGVCLSGRNINSTRVPDFCSQTPRMAGGWWERKQGSGAGEGTEWLITGQRVPSPVT